MTYTVMLTDGTSRTVHADKRPLSLGLTEWLAAMLAISQYDIDRIFCVKPLPITR